MYRYSVRQGVDVLGKTQGETSRDTPSVVWGRRNKLGPGRILIQSHILRFLFVAVFEFGAVDTREAAKASGVRLSLLKLSSVT